MTCRILTDFVIDKIAAVDKPCQEHATVTIMKRAQDEVVLDGPIIKTLGGLQRAIQSFSKAEDKIAMKRHLIVCAKALGAADELPEGWAKKFELSHFADRLAKDFFSIFPVAASVAPVDEDEDEGAEDFAEEFEEVMHQRNEWKAQDELGPYIDALRNSIVSIWCDDEVQGSDRLLAIRNSVGQFLDAVQAKYPALPEQVAATMDAANAGGMIALKSLAMLKSSVLKVKTNEMLESLKAKGTGVMPKKPPASRNSQPMFSDPIDRDPHNKQDSGQTGRRLTKGEAGGGMMLEGYTAGGVGGKKSKGNKDNRKRLL